MKTCYGWKIHAAPEGKLVRLVRADGTSDLALNDRGMLQRITPKVKGKALAKRAKKIRQELRRQKEAEQT